MLLLLLLPRTSVLSHVRSTCDAIQYDNSEVYLISVSHEDGNSREREGDNRTRTGAMTKFPSKFSPLVWSVGVACQYIYAFQLKSTT